MCLKSIQTVMKGSIYVIEEYTNCHEGSIYVIEEYTNCHEG